MNGHMINNMPPHMIPGVQMPPNMPPGAMGPPKPRGPVYTPEAMEQLRAQKRELLAQRGIEELSPIARAQDGKSDNPACTNHLAYNTIKKHQEQTQPWMRKNITPGVDGLHQEIQDFYKVWKIYFSIYIFGLHFRKKTGKERILFSWVNFFIFAKYVILSLDWDCDLGFMFRIWDLLLGFGILVSQIADPCLNVLKVLLLIILLLGSSIWFICI